MPFGYMHHAILQLVGHDGVWVVLHAVHGGWFLSSVNLHRLVSITLALTLFFLLGLILAAAALSLKVLTTIVGLLSGGIGTSHLRVINHGIGVNGGIIGTLSELGLLLLEFLSTVCVSIGDQVGLWLVRWEFGRSRILGVPADR